LQGIYYMPRKLSSPLEDTSELSVDSSKEQSGTHQPHADSGSGSGPSPGEEASHAAGIPMQVQETSSTSSLGLGNLSPSNVDESGTVQNSAPDAPFV
jgi:hypothetical protein